MVIESGKRGFSGLSDLASEINELSDSDGFKDRTDKVEGRRVEHKRVERETSERQWAERERSEHKAAKRQQTEREKAEQEKAVRQQAEREREKLHFFKLQIEDNNRYAATDNGIVVDNVMKLEWIPGPNKNTTYDEAKSWVENLDIDGGGWHMPTIKELEFVPTRFLLFDPHVLHIWSINSFSSHEAWAYDYSNRRLLTRKQRDSDLSRGIAVRTLKIEPKSKKTDKSEVTIAEYLRNYFNT